MRVANCNYKIEQPMIQKKENTDLANIQQAVNTIKTAILQSQARAAQAVNQEQLALYFGIGRYVSANTRNKNWGQGMLEQISERLRQELPGLRGFKVSHLKNMRTFYEAWIMLEPNSSVTTDNSQSKTPIAIGELEQKSAIAIAELSEPADNEQNIVHNVKNFIMTFGKGFTFCGNQVHYDKLGHDHWVDLLFYNRDLQRLVVFELKNGPFKVAYLAQLSAYLRILNDDDKRESEKEPVGIILCKSADKAYVEYVMQDFRQPMGVATYKTADEIDEEVLQVLPPKEQLQALLEQSSDNM